ncbi:dynamin family protein [Rhodococcus sp. SMB37]|uniref:dynamin family protein n=1 Tax=Rhodococcus sp. SMB37 TaxID=2512213 RepID=UPI0010D7C4A7|nr:dynamin family protein [Rhodococcus sp. SMB37]TCN52676.1 dynamin family protein [Rhodococcus sp. SMB37]
MTGTQTTQPAQSTATTARSEVVDVDVLIEASVKVLRAYGRNATAELASAKSNASVQRRTVVVVGEVQRGKSALVNALVGELDASPSAVETTTSAAVRFVPPDDRHPPGSAELLYADRSVPIPRAELPDWITSTGARVCDPTIEDLPTGAVVATAQPVLGGAVVVDTPGSGGLVASHTALATQSARQASVLVMVCDASTPLTEPEMNFLRDAAASVESVVVAVTKTDKNLRRWRPIVGEDRALIERHLQRQIPVLGVSSLRAALAAQMPPGPARDRAERASGIVELRAQINALLDARAELPQADALRTLLEGLRRVDERVASDIAVIEDSATATADLTAERDRLQDLKNRSQQWEQYLARDLTLARQAALAHLDEELDRIKQQWTTRVNKSSLEVMRRSAQSFTADMQTDLLAAMESAAQVFLERLEAIVAELFGPNSPQWSEIRELVWAAMQTGTTISAGEVGSKRQGLLDPSVLTMGMIGTSMLGAVIGVGAVAGVVWVAVNLGYKAMRTGKTNLLNWLRETLAATRTGTSRMLESALSVGRPEIVLRHRDDLKSRIEDLQSQLKEAQEAARLDAATREKTLERLKKNRKIVQNRIDAIEKLLAGSQNSGAQKTGTQSSGAQS